MRACGKTDVGLRRHENQDTFAVERGAAKDVFEHPKDAYTKLLLGAAPSLLHPELGK